MKTTMTRQRDRWAAIVAGVAVAGFTWAARPAARQGQESRATQTVAFDFVVVKKDGQPVTDIRPEEVTLRIDNRNRLIKSLQYVPLSAGMGGVASATAAGAAAITPPFATNLMPTASAPRSIVIIVDDESMPIGQEITLRAALNRFVRSLPPADPVALVTVPHGGIKVGLTTDRDRLARGISAISPIVSIVSAACQTKDTLSTLETTLGLLTRNSDQPVAVAFLSAALTGQSQQERIQRPTVGGGGVSDQAGGCHIVADNFVRVGQAVAAAKAQLYVIHPDYTPAPALEGIESLRSETGAPLFHLTSSGEPGLTRMARETAGYYLGTFETQPDELTGKPHPSSVKVSRPDVDVRDKRYIIVGRTAAAASPTASTSTPTITTAFDMVRSGRAFRDLPLRATAAPSRNAKDPAAVDMVGWFEPIDPSVKVMTAAAALIDENGTAQAYWESTPNQALTTWPVAIGLTARPGTYRLRVAAIDANGRTGLIDDTVVAEIRPAGPLHLSGLVLGLSRAGGFAPRLQFSSEAAAIAYFELYGTVTDDLKVSAVFEVSRTTDGPAMMSVSATAAATHEDGKLGLTGAIPVGALAPGDYVVRAVVTVAGQGSGRILRTLRKIG
jgi:hypothetical protein